MRLLDRILFGGFISSEEAFYVTSKEAISLNLREAQMVAIDNVAAYFRQEFEGKCGKIGASDFPNVMLPFEHTFLEMRINGSMGVKSIDEMGILMQMFSAKDFRKQLSDLDFSDPQLTDKNNDPFFSEKVAWYISSSVFVHEVRSPHSLLIAEYVTPIDINGQVILTNAAKFFFPIKDEKRRLEMLIFIEHRFLFPCFLALSFMHCRNVKMIEEIPPPKLSKKYQRKTGHPLLKYRVLQIDHMKEVLEREGKAGETGLRHALHICRGHFKHYGRDGKGLLFGKHTATVWVPMHTRGTIEEGIVVKDYDVK